MRISALRVIGVTAALSFVLAPSVLARAHPGALPATAGGTNDAPDAGALQAAPQGPAASATPQGRVTCSSSPGAREHCNGDTSAGVVLARSVGEAPCLLGKTWGYDDTGVWVSEGCSGEFILGPGAGAEAKAEKLKPFE